MITILISVIIGIGLGIYLAHKTSQEYFIFSIIGLFYGAIIGLLIVLILSMDTNIRKNSLYIENLQDNSNVNDNVR
jgi:ABC-type proline/glycine betaine transport system permease subunit